ncbi:hypothetical protein JYK14_14660 [Siccirubricoccus sp. KC 17139]|uniref:Ribulose-phosphate 3-epimerase n=1 Tax=Siccirubricoccus soli TaxID=2899147 RepID=A0ABT1D635_9PROT|nr:hypothetical protein [Siccirubricoccus soli]MCO6417396.1 hypothetical protein [Siccirubricoccus soli]MCP2683531.1 hypothetical protein [Siccirubricoccus soli]
MTQVAAPILAADFGRLAEEVRAAAQAEADLIHVDVLDSRFIPETNLGTPAIGAVRAARCRPVEAQLMSTEPERHPDGIAGASARGRQAGAAEEPPAPDRERPARPRPPDRGRWRDQPRYRGAEILVAGPAIFHAAAIAALRSGGRHLG